MNEGRLGLDRDNAGQCSKDVQGSQCESAQVDELKRVHNWG